MGADWTIDMFEQEGSLVVEAGLSGVRFEDVSVMLRDSHLVISARRPPESGVRRYHLRGRRTPREFSREVMLPPNARADLATASYAHGLLRICIPLGRDAASSGRPIPVKDLTAAVAARRRESRLEQDGEGSPAGAGKAKGGPAPDPGSGLPSQPHAVSVRRCALCNAPMEAAAESGPLSSDSRRFGLCAACRRIDPEL
jgi:HSP20 family molecular chaperone IbpA